MRIITFLLLLATGLAMALPGLWLASLGGSLYYAVAGTLILVCAWLVLRGSAFAITLYWLTFLGTLVWSLWEVGLDGWALMPRLVYLFMGGLWLLATRSSIRPATLVALLLPVLGVSGAIAFGNFNHAASAQEQSQPSQATASGDWSNYGNSQGGTRYSPLDQITPANASKLQQAWAYHTGTFERDKHSAHQLELTPIMVDGLLYGCDTHNAVYALDPATGKQVWRHDTKIDMEARGRGVPVAHDADVRGGRLVPGRIFEALGRGGRQV